MPQCGGNCGLGQLCLCVDGAHTCRSNNDKGGPKQKNSQNGDTLLG